jgi:hypothetical protein
MIIGLNEDPETQFSLFAYPIYAPGSGNRKHFETSSQTDTTHIMLLSFPFSCSGTQSARWADFCKVLDTQTEYLLNLIYSIDTRRRTQSELLEFGVEISLHNRKFQIISRAKVTAVVRLKPGVNGNAGWTSGRKKRMNVELVLSTMGRRQRSIYSCSRYSSVT